MISKEEEYVLSVALASERIASEIVARIVDSTPASPAAAQAILDIIDNSKKEEKEIKEYLTVATANRSVGKEISEQLELIVECLEYQAADDPANDAALAAAQAKLSDLSDKAKEYLIVALSSRIVANSVSSKIDVATQSTSGIASAVPPAPPSYYFNDFTTGLEAYDDLINGTLNAGAIDMDLWDEGMPTAQAAYYKLIVETGGSGSYVFDTAATSLQPANLTTDLQVSFVVSNFTLAGASNIDHRVYIGDRDDGMAGFVSGYVTIAGNGPVTITIPKISLTGPNILNIREIQVDFQPVGGGSGTTGLTIDNITVTEN